ncbi:FecR family protein [Psychroserpens sp. SPM9]|uniref:FecR family protein n=1 Tax=Psychroserpens sp. SPM9 TaxID=2975598 RepID=UPI0021A846A4|nr:FecR family protein [Psychroserpens sp. SPM9]MDG5493109.1 FecR family protein [Psychroserpens sp. SPM9]
MNRDVLIQKWLDHDLNPQELEAFKQLEDYHDLITLDTHLKGFKAETVNTEAALESVWSSVSNTPQKSHKLLPTLSKIAAVLVICFGLYYYTTTLDQTVQTLASQHKSMVLPDASKVELNAMSTIKFNKSSWTNLRNVTLDGEAFFKVEKGETFDVNTNMGTVRVLGTQFNVKQRPHYFEVTCYEGKVSVHTDTKNTTLLPGDSFLIIDGNYIATEKENAPLPSWVNHNSTFKSIPYREVIAEFERQYNVSIQFENLDASQKFTGSFTHNDIEIALKSITLPLQLKYSKTDHIIRLKRE